MIHITAKITVELADGLKLSETVKAECGNHALRKRGLMAFYLLTPAEKAARQLLARMKEKVKCA